MHIKIHKCSTALFTAETKETLKAPPTVREWICDSFSSSVVSFYADHFFMYSFTKLKSNHSVFASNLEIMQFNLD